MFGTLRKLLRSSTLMAPRFNAAVADALIHVDIGAAEAVNRLLRITDDEQLAGYRRDVFPARLARIVCRESSSSSSAWSGSVSWNSSTKIRLKRFWKCTPHPGIVSNQIARAEQQVEEIERAFALLQRLVPIDARQQFAVQQRREIRVGTYLELGSGPSISASRASSTCARVTPFP